MSSRVVPVLAALIVALVVAEWLFAPHYDPKFPWHRVPGFFAATGLAISLALIGLAKLGKAFLQRPEEPDA